MASPGIQAKAHRERQALRPLSWLAETEAGQVLTNPCDWLHDTAVTNRAEKRRALAQAKKYGCQEEKKADGKRGTSTTWGTCEGVSGVEGAGEGGSSEGGGMMVLCFVVSALFVAAVMFLDLWLGARRSLAGSRRSLEFARADIEYYRNWRSSEAIARCEAECRAAEWRDAYECMLLGFDCLTTHHDGCDCRRTYRLFLRASEAP